MPVTLGSNQNFVPRTYGVNLKHEEQIIFSRILASFAFDPPHMKPGKVVAAQTIPGELCKARVVPGLCKVHREWSPLQPVFPFSYVGGQKQRRQNPWFFRELTLERVDGAPLRGLSIVGVWRVRCLCHMHTESCARCRGVVLMTRTSRKSQDFASALCSPHSPIFLLLTLHKYPRELRCVLPTPRSS